MALPLQEDRAMTIGAKNFGEDRTRGLRNMRAEIMWIGLNLALKIGCHGNVPVSDRKTNFRSFTVRPTLTIWLTIGLVDVQTDGHIDMLIALP